MDIKQRIKDNRELVQAGGQSKEAMNAFTFLSLDILPNKDYKGFHTVYQGFNEAFRTQFPNADPIAHVNSMRDSGLVAVQPVKKGVRVYWPEDKPNLKSPQAILAKMGL